MSSRRDQFDGRRILFWADPPVAGVDLGWITTLFGMKPDKKPHDFVRNDIPYMDRQVVIKALALRSTMNPTGGEVAMSYFGEADCRMCGVKLGHRDLFGYGFIWPEKAEHYIENHNVWTPDCDALLAAVRRRG